MKHYQKLWSSLLVCVMLLTLLPAALAQGTDSTLKYNSDMMQVNVINGKTKVKVFNLPTECIGKTVLCGWYQEGCLVDVRYGTYLEGGVEITADVKNYDEIKLLAWESPVKVKPVIAPKPVEAETFVDTSVEVQKIDLEDYKEFTNGIITYDEETGNDRVYRIASNPEIIYNGADASYLSITDFFADGMIVPYGTRLGSITLIENDASAFGYDTVEIEVAVPAVVSKVYEDGRCMFKNQVTAPEYGSRGFSDKNLAYLNLLDEAVTATKNGVTYDKTQLQEWDVVLVKPSYDWEAYQLEVLDEYVDGHVSAVFTTSEVILSDGNRYAPYFNGYLVKDFKPGDEGRFYVYKNWMIAYQYAGKDDYAYITNAVAEDALWNSISILVQLIDKEGIIYERTLAKTVTVKNLDTVNFDLAYELSGGYDTGDFSLWVSDQPGATLSALADSMINRLVNYETDSDGNIKTLIFEQSSDEEADMYRAPYSNTGVYSGSSQVLGSHALNEETVIFFLDGQELTYGDRTVTAELASSGVGTIAELSDGVMYDFVAFDTGSGCAKAVIILNAAAKTPAVRPEEPLPEMIVVQNHYGYVMNAMDDENIWGLTVRMQILDESGAVYELTTADRIKIKNLDQIDANLAETLTNGGDATAFTLDTGDLTMANAYMLANAVCNRMVTYSTDENGKISAITFEQTDAAKEMYLTASGMADYAEGTMKIGEIALNKDTLVFYVTDDPFLGSLTYGESTFTAVADYCRVADGTDLAEGRYTYLAFDNGNGYAKAIVILNDGGMSISPYSNIAVIREIGTTIVDDFYVYMVEYYQDGEVKTATTAVDMMEITTANAAEGDIFRVKVIDGVIVSAHKLFDYSREGANPMVDTMGNSNVIFGAVEEINQSSNLKLSSGDTVKQRDAAYANVYVIDPNKNAGKKVYPGSFADAEVDGYITDTIQTTPGKSITVDFEDASFMDGTIVMNSLSDVHGLMDYVFAYSYNEEVLDVVIFKPYDFYYNID